MRGKLVVPPARSHHDDGAVRDGDDVRRIERDARAGAAASTEIEAFLSGADQARARFAVARSRRSRAASISTRRSSGCRRRRCRSPAWRRSKARSPARRATSPPTWRCTATRLTSAASATSISPGPIRSRSTSFSGHDLVITPQSGGSIRAEVQRAVGQGVDQHRRARNGAASTRKPRCASPMSTRRRLARAFDGSRHVRVQRAAAIRDPQSLDAVTRGPGVVPMTGTINATIVGDDYRFDHDNAFPGFRVRRQDERPHQARRGHAQHDERPGARARQRRRRGRAQRRARSASRSPTSCSRCTARIDAPMTLGGSYRYPGDRDHGHRRRRRPAAARPRRAHRRASSPIPRTATISAIDLRRGTVGDHRRRRRRHHQPDVERQAARRSAECRGAAGRRFPKRGASPAA